VNQRPRRGPVPFLTAILLAIGLIVGLRTLMGGGQPAGQRDAGQAATFESGSCDDRDQVALTLISSPEKAEVVKRVAAAYPGTGGRCVRLTVVSEASGATMAKLLRGWNEPSDGARPDVWSPSSTSWLKLLERRGTRGDLPGLVPVEVPSMTVSPQVIAMPRPMAEALGWPRRRLGWREMLDLASDPRGWAAHGHPEWGRFKLGKTNPNYSTSGLSATVGAYFAATGRANDLTVADVAAPRVRAFVGGVEQSVVHYGESSVPFLVNLRRADDQGAAMSYISAVCVEEQSVWNYNQGSPSSDPAEIGRNPRPKVPLVAIYPREGVLVADHPYAVLTAPWVDDAKRAAAAAFLDYVRGREGRQQFQRAAFRGHDGSAGPTIGPADGLDPNEPASRLALPSAEVLDKVVASWATLRKRANAVVVVDVSGSMADEVRGTGSSKLDLAKAAASNALAEFSSDDQVGLWIFSTELDGTRDHRELVPIGPMGAAVGGRRRAEVMRERIAGLQPGGGTGLYDTSLAAHGLVDSRASRRTINAVILLTDGRNEDDGISLENLLPRLRTERGDEAVRLFAIAYGDDADLGVLRRIAETTGGVGYDSLDPTRIAEVFAAVVSNF
jgi:Ca-activated chloride channel family protein